jgi:hypothetical protein
MTIDSGTGRIEWLKPIKGHYEVNVKADDGNNGSDVQIFYLTVGNIGPHITSAALLNAETWVKYVYNVTAEDTDNDKLTFSLETNVIGMEMNGTTGTLTWTPQFAGQYSAVVFVSDGELKDRQEFTITVLQGNNAPKFVSKAVVSAVVGIPYSYTAKAVDDDGDSVVYSIIDGPSGMTIENKGGNGIVSWTPTVAGNYTLTILASDGKGGEGRQELTITVVSVTRPSVEILRPIEGAKISGKVDVSGLVVKGTRDVVKVQVSVDGGEWLDASGNASWTFKWDTTKLKNGAHVLSARAFDGTDYSDLVNRTVTVDNQKAAGKGFIPGFDGMIGALAAVATMVWIVRKKRN